MSPNGVHMVEEEERVSRSTIRKGGVLPYFDLSLGAFINHVDMAGGGGVYQMSMLLHKPY